MSFLQRKKQFDSELIFYEKAISLTVIFAHVFEHCFIMKNPMLLIHSNLFQFATSKDQSHQRSILTIEVYCSICCL